MSQHAPSVRLFVKRSLLLALLMCLLWAIDCSVFVWLLSELEWSVAIQLLAAGLYAAMAVWLYHTYQHFFTGCLDWDGQAWSITPSLGEQTLCLEHRARAQSQVLLMLDIQIIMLLRLQGGQWLWLEKWHHPSSDWLALRRALFANYKGRSQF